MPIDDPNADLIDAAAALLPRQHRTWRRILVILPVVGAIACGIGYATARRQDPDAAMTRSDWADGLTICAAAAVLSLTLCLLWSIRDHLVEIRDRLPAQP